ncbi:MAG: LysR family transcriptional regulator [Clostridiales bacterium]|nr:LysR family transcriptional regulator [Clostridiales bacterium]
MRIEYLLYFLEAAQTGSITQAAKRFYISQQGMSRAIQAVENEFGVRLFDRNGNSISLTPVGKRFQESARTIAEGYEKLQFEMLTQMNAILPEGKQVEIVATPLVLNSFFPILDKALNTSPFRDNMKISELHTLDMITALEKAEPNVIHILSIPSYVLQGSRLEDAYHFEPLFKTEIMLRTGPDFPISDKETISKEEIVKLPFVYYNETSLEDLIQHMFSGYKKMNIVLKTTNIAMLRQMVMDNKAVTLTDSFSHFCGLSGPFKTFSIEDTETLFVGFLYNKEIEPDPSCAAFMQYFKKCLETVCDFYMKTYACNPDH